MSELNELLFVPGEDFEAAILTLWAHVREQDKEIKEIRVQMNQLIELMARMQTLLLHVKERG